MVKTSPEILTERIKSLVQPYLGMREYGGLYIMGPEPKTMPHHETPNTVKWKLGYEMVFGSLALIDVDYDKSTGEFAYIDSGKVKVKTSYPGLPLDHVRRRIMWIIRERKIHLRRNAQMKLEHEVSLEQAIEDVKSFAEEHPKFGPTDEELKYYERVAQEIFQSKMLGHQKVLQI